MKNIVIIEDDIEFAEELKDCLEDGTTCKVVKIFSNEDDYIHWLKSADLKLVDAFLVDLAIPESAGIASSSSLTGLRIVRGLRHNQSYPGSILVLTNSRVLEDGERALQAGCDGYLCKHTQLSEISSLISELKLAIEGNVLVVSREMRHVFMREELSTKEARLMELIQEGYSWAQIAQELGYKSAGAAATIGHRVFDKLLEGYIANDNPDANPDTKRRRALEIWRARTGRRAHIPPGRLPEDA
ncbi:MAG: response regulator [Candidatus Obscuribacterales bacterium]|nr:response regulator [Candidatus Obscuribacterales bacterium]